MRVIRFLSDDGEVYLGEEDGSVLEGEITGALTSTGVKKAITKILAPIDPVDIYCIGLNYRLHAEESGADWKTMETPAVFMKPCSSVVGPGDDIVVPSLDKGDQLDWECELAMVIGKPCKDVKAADALDYVAGYTVANDVSARFWQMNAGAGQWIIGKGFDSLCRTCTAAAARPTLTCPAGRLPANYRCRAAHGLSVRCVWVFGAALGPTFVTSDELTDPQSLRIQ
jgi:2-keto-4-pentenoate hydratase/2-oxohepta-3-ene-1,7-dioic acid hydratase in catechol pathway